MTGVTEGGRICFGTWFQKHQGECMKFMVDRIWHEGHMASQEENKQKAEYGLGPGVDTLFTVPQ